MSYHGVFESPKFENRFVPRYVPSTPFALVSFMKLFSFCYAMVAVYFVLLAKHLEAQDILPFPPTPSASVPGVTIESSSYNANGVLYALAGFSGGLACYVRENRLHYEFNLFTVRRTKIRAEQPLSLYIKT
jgi:hypothetical protein